MTALPLQPNARYVRRLRVKSRSEEMARSAATALQDALHIASIPVAEQGRLVVIRRLALGRIRAGVSSVSLALRVEAVAREMIAGAEGFDSPAAEGRDVVWFPDRATAILHLAGLHARGLDVSAWFWPGIISGWRHDRPRSEKWISLVRAAYDLPGGVLCAARIFRESLRVGDERSLLSSMQQGEVERWFQKAGWNFSRSERVLPKTPALKLPEQEVRSLESCLPEGDPRLDWAAVMLAILEKPDLLAFPDLPAVAKAAFTMAVREDRFEIQNGDANLESEGGSESAIPEGFLAFPEVTDAPGSSHGKQLDVPEESLAKPAGPRQSDEPIRAPMQSSDFAGLFFLVPVLEQLGFSSFLESHPMLLESQFSRRFLFSLGQRLGMTVDDPLSRFLRPTEPKPEHPLASQHPAPLLHILSEPAPRRALISEEDYWRTGTRRWCRRNGRFGLSTLVKRRGMVVLTPTHVDICFGLDHADVRVRRLGLDIDPGWVPWLARVVRFHYLERDEWHG